jgi:hypothetical protein
MKTLIEFLKEFHASSKDPFMNSLGVKTTERYPYVIKSPDNIKDKITNQYIHDGNDIGPKNWHEGITESEFKHINPENETSVNCRFVAVNMKEGHAIIIAPSSTIYHVPMMMILSEALASSKLKRSGLSIGHVPNTYLEFAKDSSKEGKDYFQGAAKTLDMLLGFVNVTQDNVTLDLTHSAVENKQFVNSNKNYLKKYLGHMSKSHDDTQAPPTKISFAKAGKPQTAEKIIRDDWSWLSELVHNFNADMVAIINELNS